MKGAMIMARVSNETMYDKILDIVKNTDETKKDLKEVCKQVNINREGIASQKSVIKIIETFLIGVGLAIVGLFIGKYK